MAEYSCGKPAEAEGYPSGSSHSAVDDSMMRATGKRPLGPSDRGKVITEATYMSLQKKPPSPLENAYKKPYRRWGCCSISSALIGLVFLVAVGVTLLYVFLFTDLVTHVTGNGGHTNGSVLRPAEDLPPAIASAGAARPAGPPPSTEPPPASTPAPKPRDLDILVLVIDTRTHNNDGGAFRTTTEAWRKTEQAWQEMHQSNAISDRLTVRHCQSCMAIGVRDDDRGTTIFYTVQHLKGEIQSSNIVVFVAQQTPPGEILATLTRYGRTDSLGEICARGTWSATGCDFLVGPRESKDGARIHHQVGKAGQDVLPSLNGSPVAVSRRTDKTGGPQLSFRTQALQTTELELLKFNRTIVMQKDPITFKVLIHKPMAV